MASLTGQTIQSTYDALLKISGNDALTSSLQRITDGLGNFSPLYLSTTAVEISSGLNVVGSITGSNLSGTNTGDETNSTIKSKLGAATSSNDGYLTSTDWYTFNAKQNALGYTPVPNTRSLTINGTAYDLSADRSWSVGTVTSVGLSVPTGFAVSNSPVTGSGTLGLSFAAGYSLPTNLSQASWDTAFSSRIATFTTTGNSGAATFASNTLNIPNYTLSGLGGVPTTRTLTINGTSYDLSADRSWTISTGLSGSGTTNYVPKFTGSTSLGNSLIFDNGSNVGIGTTSPANKAHVSFSSDNDGLRIQNSVRGHNYLLTTAGSSAEFFSLYDVDNSQYLYFAGNDGHSWNTQGSERMRITSGGAVGIGTSSPNTQLHVVGSLTVNDIVYLQRSSSSLFLPIANYWNGSGSPLAGTKGDILAIGNTGGDGLALVNSNAVRMFINSSGNVGIGTSSPAVKLQVQEDIMVNLGSPSTPSTGGTLWLSTNGNTSRAAAIRAITDNSENSHDLLFFTNPSFGLPVERLRIKGSTGNVGIGTSSPSGKLVVVGANNNTYLSIDNAASGENYYAANSAHIFQSAGAERMRITSGGNVGIGTTSPAIYGGWTGLDIRGGNGGHLIVANTTGTNRGEIITDGNGFNINAQTNNALLLKTNDLERMRITSSGNVGIGTSSPGYRLTVGGSILSFDTLNSTNGSFLIDHPGVNTWKIGVTNSNTSTFSIGNDNGGSFATKIFNITNAGNVGIGLTSPTDGRLQVAGNTQLGNTICQTYFGVAAYSQWITSGGAFAMGLDGAAGTTERMRITSGGNLGLNTTSPSYRLDVNGDIRSTGVIRVNTGTIDTVMTFDTGAGAIGTLTNHNLNFWINGTAQAKITTGNQFYVGTGVVNGSAKVQIDSTTQGFLPPRMTSLQRIAIATPAVGLIVYQTDNAGGLGGNEGLYVYKSGGWTFII